ncbi:hypothetical protein ACFOPN_13640 [Xanthomonas hyacinthi]
MSASCGSRTAPRTVPRRSALAGRAAIHVLHRHLRQRESRHCR